MFFKNCNFDKNVIIGIFVNTFWWNARQKRFPITAILSTSFHHMQDNPRKNKLNSSCISKASTWNVYFIIINFLNFCMSVTYAKTFFGLLHDTATKIHSRFCCWQFNLICNLLWIFFNNNNIFSYEYFAFI